MNRKLREIGSRLDVTGRDIRGMGKAGFIGRLLPWIITAIIALLSLILGFFVGRGTCPPAGGGYPYSAALIPVALTDRKKNSRMAILLISAIAFLMALNTTPVFGQAIKYNVYRRH